MIYPKQFYQSKKVLLIEDCEPVRAAIKGMLQQIGFNHITTVADSTSALQQAAAQSFDFFVADYQLGVGKDAFQMFRQLQQQSHLKTGACFVIISAETVRQPVFGLVNGLPDAYLLKPFSYLQLEKRLGKALQSILALRKVSKALVEHNYSAAIEQADELIKQQPVYTLLALRYKGESLLAAGQHEAAFSLYSHILQQRDFSWAALGQAIALFKQQQFEQAESLLLALSKREECRLDALDWLCRLYMQSRRFDDLLPELQEYGRQSKQNALVQQLQAELAVLLQQADAGALWEKYISQYRFSDFDNSAVYLALARWQLANLTRCDLAQFNTQRQALLEVLNSIPQRLLSECAIPQQLLLSHLALLSGDNTDAVRLCQELQADQLPLLCRIDLARLHFALGRADNAEQILAEAQQAPAERPACAQQLADYLLPLQLEQAVEELQQSRLQLQQLSNEGSQQLQAAKPKAALLALRQAFLLMPANTGIALNLLQALLALGPHKALAPLQQSVLQLLGTFKLNSTQQQRLAQMQQQLAQ
ncbi:tetratricopeptide repeat protein [Arsukibacterium sp.]|uniref:tetratricopeptide repeat protein n=1 Tax=Arsukibacterium sp. TaxID=1977258 RepID=UPI002FD898A6